MSRKSKKAQRRIEENERLQMLGKVIRKAKGFLDQRYVWLSLTVGFLWMLSIPFMLTILQEIWGDYIERFAWIFQVTFFPLKLSLLIFADVTVPGVWMIMYVFSFVTSMLFCLSVAYIIHRIRIKKRM
jgi:hypothetical protein